MAPISSLIVAEDRSNDSMKAFMRGKEAPNAARDWVFASRNPIESTRIGLYEAKDSF